MSGTLHPQYGALPWHRDGCEAGEVSDRSGRIVAFASNRLPFDGDAVARLIAAAPTLAASLNECVELMPMSETSRHVLARARAALALLDAPKVSA